jgi:hypothetical protein
MDEPYRANPVLDAGASTKTRSFAIITDIIVSRRAWGLGRVEGEESTWERQPSHLAHLAVDPNKACLKRKAKERHTQAANNLARLHSVTVLPSVRHI